MIVFDPAVFRVLYPQFASTEAFPDLVLEANFERATSYISTDEYGSMSTAARSQALYLMTAHLLDLNAKAAASGYTGTPSVMQSSSVGDVSVSVAPPPIKSQWRWLLNTTGYGMQLLALLEAQAAGGMMVGGAPERYAFRRVGGGFGPVLW